MHATSHRLLAATLLLCTSACSRPTVAVQRQSTAPAVASILSVDATRGVPRLLKTEPLKGHTPRATSPAEAAHHALAQHAARYGMSVSDVETLETRAVHDTGRGGILVTLRQQFHGLDVLDGDVRVWMGRDLVPRLVSGSPWATPAHAPVFAVSPEEALAAALSSQLGMPAAASSLQPLGKMPGGYDAFTLTHPLATEEGDVVLTAPARLKATWFPDGKQLRPAWWVETLTSASALQHVVAADDATVLRVTDLRGGAASYRVWAASDGTPSDNPMADFTPHPTGLPDNTVPSAVPPTLVGPLEGTNTNPQGTPDPWLALAANQTRGNNVDAYTDSEPPEGFSNGDVRATTTGPNIFDRTYDQAQSVAASTDQSMAAVTHAFYTLNWLHDWYYDAGFDEAAGNAQQDNLGRGGLAGDPLQAETINDYLAGARSSTNTITPADGISPRIQMYAWSGKTTGALDVAPGGTLPFGTATFGAQAFDLTAQLVLANDGVGTVTDACSALQNNVAGKVVLLDRGTCTFGSKALMAQQAGAVGVVVANNQPTAGPPGMGGIDPGVTIPVLSATQADGLTLKSSLVAGVVIVHMARLNGPLPDGALDSSLVAHEWGHVVAGRLASCSAGICRGMTEGWADFSSLLMMVRPGDNLAGTWAIGAYANAAGVDPAYYGLRRAPYSSDATHNALSFRHIALGEPLPTHPMNNLGLPNDNDFSVGEVWASMLFDGLVALLGQTALPGPRTFAEVRLQVRDDVVATLKLLPADATFTEARDTLLEVVAARSTADRDVWAQAFATRGLGTCAVDPPPGAVGNDGLVEDTRVLPRVTVESVTLSDATYSCDRDGYLDGRETGILEVTLSNPGHLPVAGGTVSVSASLSEVGFPSGASVQVASGVLAFGRSTVSIPVTLAEGVTGTPVVDFTVTLDAAGTCAPQVAVTVPFRVNADEVPATSLTDTVETAATVWTLQGTDAPLVWSRRGTGAQHAWHAEDLGHITDASLVSPVLHQLPGTTLTFSFSHRHSFEASTAFFDGAVLEFRTAGATSWQDLSALGMVPYGGALSATSGNPLAGRQALVATNPDWPAFTTVTLDLGTTLQGQTFQVRLRTVTDLATAAPGWDVDDLAFTGVEGTPFPSLVEDRRALCPTAPVANAGADQSAPGGAAVLLDARASTDANGDVLSFHWTQTGGAAVVLNGADTALASFTSPTVTQATVFTFSVEVRDATQGSSDETQVTVMPPAGECFIGATPYAAGAANPANPCEECAPGVSRTEWSPRISGYPCAGDALDCTRDTCNGAGVCESTLASGCLIGGACVALGADNPANACEACNPVLSTSEYSRKDTAACTAAGSSSTAGSSGPITSSSRPVSSSMGASSAAGSSSAQAASQGDGGGDGSDGGGKCGCSSSGEEAPAAPWMALAAVAFTVLRRR